ncbi:hypothetical protein E2C01_067895 [Portunus trituberculatus]|uniref:Uncharacterized protein n=1 Tax=Portunus trituberculatus TaxID=210409 RepID=A0A5B7HL24_PORTR|nr:hypothetical protein [Portunus trituberculatus]
MVSCSVVIVKNESNIGSEIRVFLSPAEHDECTRKQGKLMWEIKIVKTVAINLLTSIDPS